MELLSKDLVSHDYRDRLQADLANASICRFLVAYVSLGGVDSIGRHLLTRALRGERSFGVASLSCSCGYEPLLRLQAELPETRLKYFMDPVVKEPGEPGEIALFHSKLVYLHLSRESKSVVYIGSHNWTSRALGPRGTRNAEASVRFEFDFVPDHLDGSGTSVPSHVNRHLIDAWQMPACLRATAANEPRFFEWTAKACQRSQSAPLKRSTILLAVHRNDGGRVDWLGLAGKGIYLQVLDEDDGEQVWRSDNRLLVMVWESNAELAAAHQPVLLDCIITTNNAGPNSQLRGTNQSTAPVAGFEAVIWDDAELAAQQNGRSGRRPAVQLWSGREVQVYDFEFPTAHVDSSQVDGPVRPNYQYYLKVERVIMPSTADFAKPPEFVWPPESFSVAESRKSARLEETPGYLVDPEQEREIMACLMDVLLVDPSEAKVRPYSDANRSKVGKRISAHPLHETFLGPAWRERKLHDEYYSKAEPGALVAELDWQTGPNDSPQRGGGREKLSRLQRVFTAPMDDLAEKWREAASALRPRKDDLQR